MYTNITLITDGKDLAGQTKRYGINQSNSIKGDAIFLENETEFTDIKYLFHQNLPYRNPEDYFKFYDILKNLIQISTTGKDVR